MAETYEYRDDAGRTVRVSDLAQVPRKHLKTMTVIGGQETAVQQAPVPSRKLLKFGSGDIDPLWILAAAGLLIWRKMDNFMIRLAIGLGLGFFCFNRAYEAFFASDLVKTEAEIITEKTGKAPSMFR